MFVDDAQSIVKLFNMCVPLYAMRRLFYLKALQDRTTLLIKITNIDNFIMIALLNMETKRANKQSGYPRC